METSLGPLAALSLIVAPAMLTNASAIMGLSSSNRLAIATQRARELARQLEADKTFTGSEADRRLQELDAASRRSQLIVRALRGFYLAMGAFALATLLSLVGAVLEAFDPLGAVRAVELAALAAGVVAFGGLMTGSFHLLRETRIAVQQMETRYTALQMKADEWRRKARG
ncbi:MAG: DUF2721 domain-containing protein [Chthoniobacterales bacterium]|nr:DUF2721 domain-containing protein [Chthoniobacterales bacterium]